MSLPLGYATATDMAKVLVTYIDCPKRVRSECLSTFEMAPGLRAIKQLREAHLARQAQPEHIQFYPGEGYNPAKESAELDPINALFVRSIQRERARCW